MCVFYEFLIKKVFLICTYHKRKCLWSRGICFDLEQHFKHEPFGSLKHINLRNEYNAQC